MIMKLNFEYVGVKRKYVDDIEGCLVKKILFFYNIFKEWKEERRKILKMFI